MRVTPDAETFARGWREGRSQLLRLDVSSDLDTPVSLYLRLARGEDSAFLLESVTGGETRGRYSVVGVAPDLVWRCRGGQAETAVADGDFRPESAPPLENLRALLDSCAMDLPEGAPPMAAGLFGYLGYDMARLIERLPPPNEDPLGLPDALLLRPGLLAIIDSVRDETMLCAPAWHDPEVDAESAWQEAHGRLESALGKLESPLALPRARDGDGQQLEFEAQTAPETFRETVLRAKEYIRAGDIFQVVPSQRWSIDFPHSPFDLYRALRRTNPSPYMFYFEFGGFQVAGASPEILVRCRDRRITLRPIAGTRPRGATAEEDRQLEEELLADPKERAEHLMLLDLGRNDVGRVAKVGTVRPTEEFTVERYSHVMHIVSNVEGNLRDDLTALDALLAALPAGTVSGAPKIRAMEIIDELESLKRGVYAGALGYFSSSGDMDTCIALRTAVFKDGRMHIQAGGGVVHDSDPEFELQETIQKSWALRRAAQLAAEAQPQPLTELGLALRRAAQLAAAAPDR